MPWQAYYAAKREERNRGGGVSKTSILLSRKDKKKPQTEDNGEWGHRDLSQEYDRSDGRRKPPHKSPRVKAAMEASREAVQVQHAPQTWTEFDAKFDSLPAKPPTNKELLRQKVLELQRVQVHLKAQADGKPSMGGTPAKKTRVDLKQEEARLRRDVAALRRDAAQ